MAAERPPTGKAITVRHFRDMKSGGEPITVLTCYDSLFASLLEEEGIDMILVGDSLGQVVLGFDSTLPVRLEDMIRHASAVRRGAPNTFIVVDLPFLSYQPSPEEAVRSAGRVMQESRAQAVKLEGGSRTICEVVRRIVEAGIPVMGHVGFVPQSVHVLGGNRVQGTDPSAVQRMTKEAEALEQAGCFAVVLELVPGAVAREISRALTIPTIGIGAGPDCDGQVLVLPDALGLNPTFSPRFLKRFADLSSASREGVRAYISEVKAGSYPGPEHTFGEE